MWDVLATCGDSVSVETLPWSTFWLHTCRHLLAEMLFPSKPCHDLHFGYTHTGICLVRYVIAHRSLIGPSMADNTGEMCEMCWQLAELSLRRHLTMTYNSFWHFGCCTILPITGSRTRVFFYPAQLWDRNKKTLAGCCVGCTLASICLVRFVIVRKSIFAPSMEDSTDEMCEIC